MYKKVHQKLLEWYKTNGRHDLPWRLTNDPYKVYVSEIMLQQTQVKTVLERFYFPFLEAFPTLEDLANAKLNDVLKKWEGLGYYTRARNLHKAAQLSTPDLPQSVHELKALPGIGESTAHAVAAFAYHTPVPIMDANIKRILYRVFGIKKATDKALWEFAHKLFDGEHPYDYNQAMMDLGSMLCQSRRTVCEQCPFASVCLGKEDPFTYPQKKVKKAIPVRKKKIIVHHHHGHYGMRQRSSRFLHGLWSFTEIGSDEEMEVSRRLGDISQQYSHFRLDAEVFIHEASIDEHEWFTLEEISSLALSGADHKVLTLLKQR